MRKSRFAYDDSMRPLLRASDNHLQLTFEREVDANATEEERIEALDEQPYMNGYNLDVDLLVYGELVVNMPMKVLCRDDCKEFVIDVEQISIMRHAPVMSRSLTQECRLSVISLTKVMLFLLILRNLTKESRRKRKNNFTSRYKSKEV